jgi:hypothetical protein
VKPSPPASSSSTKISHINTQTHRTATRQKTQEFITLGILPANAAPIHLRELDLHKLVGLGMQEYWAVGYGSGLK